MVIKCVVKNGISTHQPQLLDPPRFLNHQQCYQCEPKKNFEISKGLWIFSSFILDHWFSTPQKNHLSKLPSQNHFCPEIYVSPPAKKKWRPSDPAAKKHDKKPEDDFATKPRCQGVSPFAVRLPEAWPHAFLAGVWLELNGVGEGWGRFIQSP